MHWIAPTNPGVEGTHNRKWYGDVPPSRPSFSGHMLAPATHLSKPFSSSRDPTCIFGKNLAFQDHILAISTKFESWDTNFGKILFLKPQLQARKSVLEILFLKHIDSVILPWRALLGGSLHGNWSCCTSTTLGWENVKEPCSTNYTLLMINLQSSKIYN